MKNRLKAIFALLLLAAALWVLHNRHGALPPLGKFLDPVNGFWRNNAASDALPERLAIAGLHGQVTVVWDDRHVPHIFAENDDDLYRAQGYLTARDRLWQMDFLSRYAGGRLAEVIGPRVREMDLLQRRLGMTWGAENFLKGIAGDAAQRRVLAAYCGGVNAYVDSLKPAAYPLEYKILDYAPSRWTPFDIALLLKYMAWDLTGYGNELGLTRTRAAAGEAVVDGLFPFFAPFQDPVIPAGTEWPAAPPLPGRQVAAVARPGPVLFADPFGEPVGSNNWAVAGKRRKAASPSCATTRTCSSPCLRSGTRSSSRRRG